MGNQQEHQIDIQCIYTFRLCFYLTSKSFRGRNKEIP